MYTPTMLSRSGRTSADGGKLIQRLDIPVSEELHDLAVVAAAQRGVPKAEFLRELLNDALSNGLWLPLADDAQRALEVLSTLRDMPVGPLLLEMIEKVLREHLDMLRSLERTHAAAQLDECGKGRCE